MLDHLNTLVTNQRAAQAELDDCWTATITQAIQTNDLNMLKQLLGAKHHSNLPSRSLAAYHPLHFHVTTNFSNHPVT